MEHPKDTKFIDLTPTPQGMVDTLLLIYNNSTKPEDRKEARQNLINAMTIAYAYWYGKTKPEYHIKNIGDSEPLANALQHLIAEYWKNKGSDGKTCPHPKEFIACITPKGIPAVWRNADKSLANYK